MTEKQTWQEKARDLARQAEAELKSERVQQRLGEARAAVDEALASDQAKRLREDAKALGARARTQVEQTLERDEIQKVREDVQQIGEKARRAVDAAVQRPDAQELRRKVESVIEDVGERLRSPAAEDKNDPPKASNGA
ncbi:MAG: hypothetical protein OXU21_01770 [Chloroflexota bacterium]|nr:hypothetical protein [Chloroflexota bacterium]